MNSTRLIKVMVVDDHPVVRSGLRHMLNGPCDMEVVGDAADGVEAVRTAAETGPDVVVMDVIMPNKDGVDACREIIDVRPDTRVLVLMDAVGASGYILKYTSEDELITAVRDVAGGRLLLPAETVRRVFEELRSDRQDWAGDEEDTLTDLEREVLTLFASGRTYAQIGEERGNSAVTVRNTLYRIQDK